MTSQIKAAGIMYVAGDKVLLGKRNDDHAQWAFPGGKLELDETPSAAAIREFYEETGHTVKAPLEHDYTERNHVCFTTFLALGTEFEATLNEEHTEFAWAPLDDLPSPLHPCITRAIEKYMSEKEKRNASQLPKFFYCRHMQPGTCGYEDETVLVDTDCMKSMIKTGEGLPVYIDHQDVKLETLKTDANGYITESFYNELDGWAWFKVVLVDDEAQECARQKWAVSNAWRAKQFGAGGTKNNVPFDREVKEAYFTHLAIVQNPRYEEACMLTPEEFKKYQEEKRAELAERKNSKPSKESNFMFKFFKNKREEVTEIDDETMVDIGDGVTVSVKEMRNSLKDEKTKAAAVEAKKLEEEKKNKKNEEEMVNCDGEMVSMNALIASYKKNKMSKKNDDDGEADEEKKKKKDAENKKNSDDEAEEKKKEKENAAAEEDEKKNALEEEKKNSMFMEELRNANNRAAAASPTSKVLAPGSGLKRGEAMFGSAKKSA